MAQRNRVLSNYARQSTKTGLAIVLSDLFDANGYERGLDALAYGNFDVLLIQLVDEAEINPQFEAPYACMILKVRSSAV